jgi:citrate lyase beta subunit
MRTRLDAATTARLLQGLDPVNAAFEAAFPGDSAARQPLHTLYGGAHRFRADSVAKLGELARRHLHAHAPDHAVFAEVLGLRADVAEPVWLRTLAKLESEPIEDLRLDFEDGYGPRPDPEEDATAVEAARELANAMAAAALPPFVGIRPKGFSRQLAPRAVRTIDLFVSTLLEAAGRLPAGFVVTLPKVQLPEQVTALVAVLGALEAAHGLPDGAIAIELMIETPQALPQLSALLAAAAGRCRGAHFGTYDYTAAVGITAAHQAMTHPAATFAKHAMQAAFAGTGVFLSDGATTVLPIGAAPVVHAAWKLAYGNIRHSLAGGFYQGWDLHPSQLPVRYAASYAFFLEGLPDASARMQNFVDQAAQATRTGAVFDDAATGQGLLNFFGRALNCGAIGLHEAEAAGLTPEDLRDRSFAAILARRRG